MKKSVLKSMMLMFGLVAGIVSAQNITGKSTKITVAGTSPLHDWTMTSTTASFSGLVSGNAINNIKFTTTSKNLKSTKGKMMDNKAYTALKAEKFPTVSFSATSMNIGKSNVTGKLTIAGVTKNVTLPVTVVKNGNSYTITGSENMTLSEFGMERPGFLGVKTGDAVTVTVNIVAN